MYRLNQKGGLDPLVIVLLVIVLALGGYVAYTFLGGEEESEPAAVETSQQSESTEGQTETASIPAGWTEFEVEGVTFVLPETFSEGEKPTDNDSGAQMDAILSDSSSNRTVSVYKNSPPRLFYSANAPYMCVLEDNDWANYSISTGANPEEQKLADDDGSCNRVENRTFGEYNGASITGGALGRTIHITVVNFNNTYFVLSEYVDYPAEPDGGGESDAEALSDELVAQLDEFTTEFAQNN